MRALTSTAARFKETLEKYLEQMEKSQIRTLNDLIHFNEDYKYQEMPPGA